MPNFGASRGIDVRLGSENMNAIVFDIDNTLTPPREPLDKDMAERLSALGRPFALAAGSDRELLMSQFFEPLHAHGYRGEFDACGSLGGRGRCSSRHCWTCRLWG